MKRVVCVLIVGLFAFGLFASLGSAEVPVVKVKAYPAPVAKGNYTTHAPIRINSDNDTNWTAFPGHVISGLEINGTGYGICIYIGNCTQVFSIKDCYLHNASGRKGDYFWNTGMYVYNCSNGTVNRNICSLNSGEGLYVYFSNNNLIITAHRM
jgi:parallel beta-helix repeat protein